MTVIVGYVDTVKKEMLLSGDTMAVSGDDVKHYLKTKIYSYPQHKMLLGFAGNTSIIQKIVHELNIPERDLGIETFEFICRDIRDSIEYFTEDEGNSDVGVLVAYEGGLFSIDLDGCVVEATLNYHAIGSGQKTALGSLYTSEYLKPEADSETKVFLAVKAASEVIVDVGGEPTLIKMKY